MTRPGALCHASAWCRSSAPGHGGGGAGPGPTPGLDAEPGAGHHADTGAGQHDLIGVRILTLMDTLDCSKCQFPLHLHFSIVARPGSKGHHLHSRDRITKCRRELGGSFRDARRARDHRPDRVGVTCHVMSLVTSDVLRRCVTRTASYSSDRDPSSLLKSPPAPSSPASSSGNGEFEGSERERFFESGTQVCGLQ